MIPNICHFIFGLKEQTSDFLFCYYVAVYSAFLVNKPDIIYFYYHYEPFGDWWIKLKNIPNIKLVKVDIPMKIANKPIIKTAHRADKLRMEILFEKGGIYLDIDTICIKPWKHLLTNNVVLGKEFPTGICNAIMFTEPRTPFFGIWMKNYVNYFNPNGWREASIILPKIIAQQFPHLLTIKEANVFFLPTWNEIPKIFVNKMRIPNSLISLHLWETHSLKYMKNINGWSWADKNSHTMYGKMLLNLIQNYAAVT